MRITNFSLNTIITGLQSPEWETLLTRYRLATALRDLSSNSSFARRIGEDAMIHLLLDTDLFLSLPNDCLCQINGEPLIHIRPSTNNTNESSTKTKRLHEGELNLHPCKRRKLHQTSFVANLTPRVNKRVLTSFLLDFFSDTRSTDKLP
jgi:hypothetical protein